MRRPLLAAAVAVVTVGILVALGAPAAHAATPAIELSRDGATWAPTLTSPLFAGVLIVPGGAATRTLYVRNNAPQAGYLRLTVRDVTTNNLDFADASRLRADVPGWPGQDVPLGDSRPCSRLVEGPLLAPGGSDRIDLTARLEQLDGLHGQNGQVALQIVVSVSSEPLGLGAYGCPLAGDAIDGFDPLVTPTHRSSAPIYVAGPDGWTPAVAHGSTPGTLLDPDDPDAPSSLPMARVSANTERLHQEWDVALWLLAVVLGAIAATMPRRTAHAEIGIRARGPRR